jgi:long-chain acyl-CoA synthetase
MSTPRTLVEAFRAAVRDHPDRPALRSLDTGAEWTWAEVGDDVDRLSAGLGRLGVGPGDTVALLLPNRPEWQIADLSALTLGATPFSLFVTASPDQNVELLRRSSATVLITEARYVDRLHAEGLPSALTVVTVDDPSDEVGVETTSWRGLLESPPEKSQHEVAPSDVATLIWTSGTSGPPKPVQLGHESILFIAQTFATAVDLSDCRTLSYLPHAHIVDRIVGLYLPVINAGTVTTVSRVSDVFTATLHVRPTFFTSVPRLWQRLHGVLEQTIQALPEPRKTDTLDALATSKSRVREAHSGDLGAAQRDFTDHWFGWLRRQIGLDAAPWLITGSAPLPEATHEFFAAVGMPLHDLWGLSETTAVATWSTPGGHRIGPVGKALPGTEVVLADDGEILVKGPNLALGYRDDPAATTAAFSPDGWFSTGDLGEISADGIVTITGRKKELIVSAGGENMSPSRIENILISASPLISSVMVIGGTQPYNVALIVVDRASAPAGLAIEAEIADAVAHANNKLSRAEKIRRHAVLDTPWSSEGGEFTPTLKLRRGAVQEKFAAIVATLYDYPDP